MVGKKYQLVAFELEVVGHAQRRRRVEAPGDLQSSAFTGSVYKVAFEKSIPAQILQLILYMSKHEE